jgi:cytochrome P450
MGSVENMHQKLNPYSFYSYMRKNNPLEYNGKIDVWNAYRYNDIKKILTNFSAFSSDFTKFMPQDQEGFFRRTLISYDPPFHRYLRNTISSTFNPSEIEKLGPRIKNVANDLINKVIDKGSMDLVRDFSYPLPVTVIAELLGIPPEDRPLFKMWADELLKSIDEAVATGAPRRNERIDAVRNEMEEYFRNAIAKKREKPEQDLITQLLKAEADGRKLSEEELLSFCGLLLQAGHLTTVNLINNCIWSLLENPAQLAKLKNSLSSSHPTSSTLDLAIEETLRYRSPVQALVRFSTKDTELGGKTIRAGKRVVTWIGSANHDESIFTNPEEFDILRSPNPHIAFGAGIHLCLGAPLARLEGHIALNVLMSRLQSLEFDDDPTNLEPIAGSSFLFGVKNLPLKFEPVQSIRSPS